MEAGIGPLLTAPEGDGGEDGGAAPNSEGSGGAVAAASACEWAKGSASVGSRAGSGPDSVDLGLWSSCGGSGAGRDDSDSSPDGLEVMDGTGGTEQGGR